VKRLWLRFLTFTIIFIVLMTIAYFAGLLD
jgi:hypothetical protein